MPLGKNGNAMKPSPYMREHSQHIRFLSKHSGDTIEEDPIVTGLTSASRIILVIACRNRQRLLSHAWQLWVNNTGVFHNYKQDVITILSRIIPEDELRTELEIEIIFKWVLQNHHIDPTGIAYTLYMCNSKAAIIKAIQHFRLERYAPSLPIMLQGDFPRPEEGHYTILHGLVDIVIFPPDSPELLRLHTAKKNKHENEIIEILKTGKTIDTMLEGAGFGELSTITGMKRSASVRAHYDHTTSVDLIVIPQIALLDLLEHRRIFIPSTSSLKPSRGDRPPSGNAGNADNDHNENQLLNYPSAEVMDYLRQSGLIYKAAMIDVMEAARCMIKTQYIRGSILYQKYSYVNKIYIILYGEVLLDTRSYEEGFSRDLEPFQHLDVDKCYVLRSGSILGDEGMNGKKNHQYFESSAIVISETAVFFEVTGYGITFLLNRLGIEKYSALVYKDIPVSSIGGGTSGTGGGTSGTGGGTSGGILTENNKLESLNDDLILHSTFMSLRKAIAMQNPYRGKVIEVKKSYLLKEIEIDEKEQEGQLLERNLKYHLSSVGGGSHEYQPSSPQPQHRGGAGGRAGGSSSPTRRLSSSPNRGGGYLSPSRRPLSPPVTNSQRSSTPLHRLPSRLPSPGSGHGSKPSTPMGLLPSTNTPLGLMVSTNHRLSKAMTRHERLHSPSHPHPPLSRVPYSPSQKSQTHVLRIDSPDHHELTIFETKNYSNLNSSTKSNSFRLPHSRSRGGSPTIRDTNRGGGGGRSETGSPPGHGHGGHHPSRPYSRQSDKEAFFKTLEGARYKKVKVLKPAALHHVQSIYKLIKKREMKYMRLQATVCPSPPPPPSLSSPSFRKM
jgi:CRP-like cAMP-binding protein